jgi:hypothetical protein
MLPTRNSVLGLEKDKRPLINTITKRMIHLLRNCSYFLFKSSYEIHSRELEDKVIKADIEKG